jgi:hypothetical protein
MATTPTKPRIKAKAKAQYASETARDMAQEQPPKYRICTVNANVRTSSCPNIVCVQKAQCQSGRSMAAQIMKDGSERLAQPPTQQVLKGELIPANHCHMLGWEHDEPRDCVRQACRKSGLCIERPRDEGPPPRLGSPFAPPQDYEPTEAQYREVGGFCGSIGDPLAHMTDQLMLARRAWTHIVTGEANKQTVGDLLEALTLLRLSIDDLVGDIDELLEEPGQDQ